MSDEEQPAVGGGHLVRLLVVAYGQPDLLARSLAALPDLDGVVVDNSNDAEVRRVVKTRGLTYVGTAANVGYAAGVNIGLAELARQPWAPHVLLLNPDAVLAPEGLSRLVDVMQRERGLAACAPTLVSPDGRREPTVWPGPSPAQSWIGALGIRRRPGFSFLNGAVLLLSRVALDQIGGFDERFFLYAEECDWQYRAVRAGWTVTHVPEVTATHVGGATSSNPRHRLERFHVSAVLYVQKWYGRAGATLFIAGTAAAAARRLLTGGATARREQWLTLLLAGRNLVALHTGALGQPPQAQAGSARRPS